MFEIFFYYIGMIFSIYYLCKLIRWIHKYYLLSLPDFKNKYGDGFVIITGGSSGIGFSFAKEFVKLNFKILLISSSKQKLLKAKQELEKINSKPKIEILPFNLNQTFDSKTIEDFDKNLTEILGGEEISVLINNAGVITRKHLCDITDEQILSMLNVNTIAVTFITKIVLQKMLKRKNRSLIVGSGSVMGTFRFPTRSVYGSTKSYLEAFYESLQREYGDRVDFTDLEIGPVETELNKLNMPLKIDSDSFCSNTMKYLGKYNFTTSCLKHEINVLIIKKLPFVKDFVCKYLKNKFT